jgi:dTDP-4-amino-4,6-dideoxygalactose transaminase
VPVHFAGRPADLAGIVGFAEARGAIVVSDAAHAIEARQAGRGIATLAPLTAYSFYPTKNITTGEGGAIATDDAHLAERLRVLRLHGLSADAWQRYSDAGTKHYEAIEVGFKANMTDMQASLGLSQLAKIEAWSRRRTEIWERYDAAFADVPATTPSGWPAGDRHARHLYTLGLELDRLRVDRDDVAHALHLEGIGTGVHYRGVHLQPAYRARLGVRPGDFPASSRISERTLSIPLGPALDDDDVSDVIAAVTRVLAYYTR